MRISNQLIKRRFTILITALLGLAGVANAYLVGPALTLNKLSSEADIIFKGTAVATRYVQDDSVKKVSGFVYCETEFKIVSRLHVAGRLLTIEKARQLSPGKTLQFRHYDHPRRDGVQMSYSFQPQHYQFHPKRTYIVFAKKTAKPDVYKQLWFSHRIKEDQGVLLCGNDKPQKSLGIKEAFWTELAAMLKSSDAKDVVYAIRQLDSMSSYPNKHRGTGDFQQEKVQAAIHKLIASENPDIAQTAIPVVGSHNPFMSEYGTDRWLVAVATAEMPYRYKMKPAKVNNIGGKLYWPQLAGVVNSEAPAKTRSLAIGALGFVGEKKLRPNINRWLSDRQPDVRAAATLLLADFPGEDTVKQLYILVKDPTPQVRGNAAMTIGILQQKKLVGMLAKMLDDKDKNVRRNAASSLQSFSPKDPAVAKVFRDNLKNTKYHTLFLNALAQNNPKEYIDEMALVINKTSPERWKYGQVRELTTWKILFKYIKTIPTETLKSGTYDRYLDTIDSIGGNTPTNPRKIYSFYTQRGMTERAAAYRNNANEKIKQILDYYFKDEK